MFEPNDVDADTNNNNNNNNSNNSTTNNKDSLNYFNCLIAGALFAIGLAISGMTLPEKIIHFLQLGKNWDPSLIFVMMGALSVSGLGFWWMRAYYHHSFLPSPNPKTPLFSSKIHLPLKKDIDWKLICGAILFGVGWALGGYCPGPGIVSATAGQKPAIIFLISMVIGMILHHFYKQWFDYRFSSDLNVVVESKNENSNSETAQKNTDVEIPKH